MKITTTVKDVVVLVTVLLLHATDQVHARGGRSNPRNVNFFSRADRAGIKASVGPKKYTLDSLPYRASPLSSSRTSSSLQDDGVRTQVGVIIGGAGMSGVSVASTLAGLDMDDYMLFEASRRVGGRMNPVTIGASGTSYTVERGANWCEGDERNPLSLICQELGLDGFEDFFEFKVYDQNGAYSAANTEFSEGSECKNMDDAYNDAYFYGELCVVPGTETVLGTENATACNAIFSSFVQPVDRDDYSHATLFSLTRDWSPATQTNPAIARACEFYYVDWDFATESDRPGIVGNFDGLLIDSALFVADSRGFKATAEAVAASAFEHTVNGNNLNFDNDVRLQLGTKVLKVKWDPKGVNDVEVYLCRTIRMEQSREHELYPCMSGEQNFFTVTGKTFVSTFSLGVLKKSVELERAGTAMQASYDIAPRFDPPLSSIGDLVNVIDRNSLGVFNKVFLQFAHVFWDTDVPYMLSAASGGIFQGLDFKAYSGSKIIYVMVTGQRAVDMAQKTQDQVLDDILQVLSAMYSTAIAASYGGRSSLAKTDVLDYTFAKWNSDPLFYGSYSIGATSYFQEDYQKFAKGRGNLYFAGEATCAYHWGYVHGAMFSGDRTARMVLTERHGWDDIDVRSLCDFSPEELAESPDNNDCIGKIPLVGDFLGGIPLLGDVLNFLVCLVLKVLAFIF